MIKIKLGDEEKNKLKNYRGQSSSGKSEKALMVLMSGDGKSPVEIAESLKRHPHTTRKWLKNYKEKGATGLERRHSPGRPDKVRREISNILNDILMKPPTEHGYQEGLWTVGLIVHYLSNENGIKVSSDTVERALKKMGYSYKRPAKGVSSKAPSKEEKEEAVKKITEEIFELASRKDCEIFALDESHFSNEPYIVKGWQKKRWPPENTEPGHKREDHVIWMLESSNSKILLEKIKPR